MDTNLKQCGNFGKSHFPKLPQIRKVTPLMDNDISDPDSPAKDVSDEAGSHVPAINDCGNRDGAIFGGVLLHAWRELKRVNTSIEDIGKTLAKISVIYSDDETLSD